MSGFFSRLIAGGLSAGVVLVWWPVFFAQDGPTSWVLRGLLWTLISELLTLTLSPLEKAVGQTQRVQQASARLTRISGPLRSRLERQRLASLAVGAACALSLPVGLLASGADHVKTAEAKPAPVKQVKVTNVTEVTKVTKVTKVIRAKAPQAKVERETVIQEVPVRSNPRPSKSEAASSPSSRKTQKQDGSQEQKQPQTPIQEEGSVVSDPLQSDPQTQSQPQTQPQDKGNDPQDLPTQP